MMIKSTLNSLLIISLILLFNEFVSAQGFKGIIPLESTCEDVKRILKVEECTLPRTTYWLENFRVSITFTKDNPIENDKLCYKVPAGRVLSLSVSFNRPVRLKDFDYEVKFAKELFNDMGSVIYEDAEKGVSAYVQNELITTAIFIPTPEQHNKYAYDCKSGSKQEKQRKHELGSSSKSPPCQASF